MSQVVVHNKDKKVSQQEKNIDTESCLNTWKKSDATKTLKIEKIIALLAFPIVLFWAMLLAFLAFGVFICLVCFKALGYFFKNKKN
jgi:hypothetical protein